MRPKLNLKIFSKFFWGVASEKEKEHVYNSQESHQMLKKYWDSVHAKDEFQNATKKKILNNINEKKEQASRSLVSLNQKFLRIAAVLILTIAVGSVMFIFTDISEKIGNRQISYVDKSNSKGERSKIVLPDNSVIWLNADSKIRYPDKFEKGDVRKVNLEGEAYFDVTHNAEKPFVVEVNGLSVDVLGTTFNIKAYPENEEIKTTLIMGKVGLSSSDNKDRKHLEPGNMGVYKRTDKTIEIRKNVNLEEIISWKEGKLVFDNRPFDEIASELERWYGIDIHIEDELKGQYRYTLTITNENIQEVCRLFQETAPIHYKIEGKHVYFSKIN